MRPAHILVLYKISTYQHYQKSSVGLKLDSDEIDRFRKTHDAHYQAVQHIEDVLHARELSYQKVTRGQLEDYSDFDLIITVGGDGTFLEGARYINDQMMLGVNSDPNWSVGRLCLANPENFENFIDDILNNRSKIIPLNRVSVNFQTTGTFVHSINDILIAHTNPASLSRYKICINSICEEQRNSGMWISTAAGSTGAIHSAGGEILDFESDDFQYMPRELYHGWQRDEYKLKGGVLSKNTKIEITSLMNEGLIFIDGSHHRIPFTSTECVTISQADLPLSMIQMG